MEARTNGEDDGEDTNYDKDLGDAVPQGFAGVAFGKGIISHYGYQPFRQLLFTGHYVLDSQRSIGRRGSGSQRLTPTGQRV